MSAAIGSFTRPRRTITIHSDILLAMLLPRDPQMSEVDFHDTTPC